MTAFSGEGFSELTMFGVDPDTADMAEIIRECCRRVRPDLVGRLNAAPGGAAFTVTAAMSGRRYRVTVTEDQP